MKIACFGDSMTLGWIGYSYIRYLRGKYKVVNHGVNGDTTICTYKRLQKYIEKPKNDDTDLYVIEIGTNDLLHPYMTTISYLWKLQESPRVKMKKCIQDDQQFLVEYEKYIRLIQTHKKKMIAIGLPLLQLKDYPNDKVRKRNQLLETLCRQYHIPFVDPVMIQEQNYPNMTCTHSWKHKNILRCTDAILMFLFWHFKDCFAKIRKLDCSVDGVHLTAKFARLIAKQINIEVEQMDLNQVNIQPRRKG